MGSDLPLLEATDLDRCLTEASAGESGSVVLAPTEDGGFWCVAGPADLDWFSVFAEVDWSSGREREQCEARLRGRGLPVRPGPPGLDVDDLKDLGRVARILGAGPKPEARRTREVLGRYPEIGVFSPGP